MPEIKDESPSQVLQSTVDANVRKACLVQEHNRGEQYVGPMPFSLVTYVPLANRTQAVVDGASVPIHTSR